MQIKYCAVLDEVQTVFLARRIGLKLYIEARLGETE